MHAPRLVAAVHESVAEVRPWLPWCSPDYSLEMARSWISEKIAAARQGTEYQFALIESSGRYIGGIGNWMRSSETGRGKATEALKLIVAWARGNTRINRLEVVAAVDNHASRRVAEKAGAAFEGIARARLLIHGRYHDAAMYSFTVDGAAA